MDVNTYTFEEPEDKLQWEYLFDSEEDMTGYDLEYGLEQDDGVEDDVDVDEVMEVGTPFECGEIVRIYEEFEGKKEESEFYCSDSHLFGLGIVVNEASDEVVSEEAVKEEEEIKDEKKVVKRVKRGKKGRKGKFKCMDCGKVFPRKSNYDSHIRVHLETKPHVCQFCSKAFVRRSDMNRHERSLHLKTTFKCSGGCGGEKWGCGRVYSRKDGLRKHWKSAPGRVCLEQFLEVNGIEEGDVDRVIEMTDII